MAIVRRFSSIYILLAIATIALVVSLLMTLNVLSDELKNQQDKYRDSFVWNSSQLEREGRVFLQQLLLLDRGDPLVDGEKVQQAFDIFWSRTETVQGGQIGQMAAQLNASDLSFVAIHEVLEICDPLVVRVVQGEHQLIPSIYTAFQPLLDPIHHFVQITGNAAMQEQELERKRFILLKQKAVWLLLAGFCSGTLLAGLLLTRQRALGRLHNSLEQQVLARTEDLSKANLALNDEVLLHRKAKDEAQNLRNLLANIISLMPSQLIGVDAQRRVILWNRQIEESSGLSADAVLSQPLEQCHPDLAAWLEASAGLLAEGKTATAHRLSYPAGSGALIDIIAYPLSEGYGGGVVIRIDDVTERVKMDERMIHSEKMVSIGGLAAGMAHEINNPLAGIIQNLQVIEQRVNPEFEVNQKVAHDCGVSVEGVRQYFEQRKLPKLFAGVRESTQRAAKIVSNLQWLTRKSTEGFKSCELSELMDSAWDMVRSDCRLTSDTEINRILVGRDYDLTMPEVECQPGQLQQVFFNLLKNSVQALGSKRDDAKITLRIMAEQDHAVIEIEDNGPGIEEEIRKRIFEPFFTTTDVGSGVGLGLSVSYMIVCGKHGGVMNVDSSLGEGSRFVIRLPLTQMKMKDAEGL